jgi:hypothetical protein
MWIAGAAVLGMVLTIGGYVWRLASRMSLSDAATATALQRADTAALAVQANAAKVEKVASELADHREEVAKEYVSYKHMTNLENRLVEAIMGLGNRIDALFSRVAHPG